MIQLSFSAAQRYINSPMSYFLHYFMRLRPLETSSALVFGSAVDSGLNSLLCDMRDGREVSLDRAKLEFDKVFKGFKAEDIKYSKADKDLSILNESELNNSPIEYYCLIKKGHLILEAYKEQVLPKLDKVILVQHEIALKNDLGDTFIGVVDLVAEINGKITILDNKTSSIKYGEDAADISEQLGTYYEALKDEYKIEAVGFIVIPKNFRKKKEPLIPIEIKLGNIKEEIIDKTFEMYDNVLKGIKSGNFQCSGCKSQPWPCVYANYCKTNGSDLTGLKLDKK